MKFDVLPNGKAKLNEQVGILPHARMQRSGSVTGGKSHCLVCANSCS